MSEEKYDEIFTIVDDDNQVSDVPPTEEEFQSAEEIITANDEIAAQNKEKLEQLESPLIVHKVTDASYQETASEIAMEETHIDEDEPTLQRHRFRKDQKKKSKNKNAFVTLLVILVICGAVFAGLYYGGVFSNQEKQEITQSAESTTETTTSIVEAYQGKIVIKGTYIFVDGLEVNGIEGLQNALKYVDPSPTAYEIVKENANSDFLNNDVLPLLLEMKFYDKSTVITSVVSSGLVADEELTTVPSTTKKKKSKKNKKNKDSNKETTVNSEE